MADAARKKPVQSAHSSNHIGFGQFGTPTYDESTHSWTFLRQPTLQDPAPFKLIRGSIEVGSRTANPPNPKHGTERLAPTWFLKNIPEATTAAREHSSNSASDGRLRNSTEVSSSIDFGNALVLGSDDVQSGAITTPISAIVNSRATDQLLLSLLDRESVRVQQESEPPFDVQIPHVPRFESVSWSTPGDPIEQVSFARRLSIQDASWLLVRRACFVNVFQPLFHRTKARPFGQERADSSLDPNLLVEISCSDTGGLMFADARFRPHNSRELIIVDMGGNWSVWRIHGIRSRSTRVSHQVRLTAHGSIAPQISSVEQFDGWHKAAWLSSGGSNTDRLLICNRQSLTLLDLQGRVLSQRDVRIGSKKGSWVLDIAVASSNYEFFVLTGTEILCMTTAGSDNVPSSGFDSLGVLAYFNHLRGSRDYSLKLGIIQQHKDIWLFLSSGGNPIITAYQWSIPGADDSGSYSGSDAVQLPISSLTGRHMTCLATLAVMAEINDPTQRQLTGLFVKIFGQDQRGDLFEILYWVPRSTDNGEECQNAVALPKRRLTQHQSAYRVMIHEDKGDLTGFVVADTDVDKPDSPQIAETDLLISQISEMTLHSEDKTPSPHLKDMRRIYSAFLNYDAAKDVRLTFPTFFKAVEQFASDMHAIPPRSVLTSDVPTTLPYVSEIEENSRTLEIWSRRREDVGNRGDSLQSAIVPYLGKSKSLIEIYDELVDTWISPLTNGITNRSRAQRERLLRQIALEMYLAGTTIGQITPDAAAPHKPPRDLDSAMITLTTPSESGRPDTLTSTTIKSSQTPLPPDERPRPLLSSFTTFKPPRTTKPSSPIDDILAHLPVSASEDPSSYSHDHIELQLALERNDLATQDLDAKSRRRAERLARAHRRQLEKQAHLQKTASASIPSVAVSSQLPIRHAQSSQAPSSSQPSVPQLTMTQPERGAHGTRDGKKPAKSKGKTSRQRGF